MGLDLVAFVVALASLLVVPCGGQVGTRNSMVVARTHSGPATMHMQKTKALVMQSLSHALGHAEHCMHT